MDNISNNYIRQIALILIIVLLGGLIFWQLKSFLPAFLGAYTLYIISRRWMFSLTVKLKGRTVFAALILIFLSFIIILLPVNGLLSILTSRILPAMKHSTEVWASTEQWLHSLEQKYGVDILTQANLKNIGEWGVTELQKVVGATFNGLLTVAVMYFILFFMLIEGKTIENSFYKWLPFMQNNVTFLKKHLNNLVISNAIGIPLVALCQSVVALIGYWIAGVQEPFLWFIATCIAAVIPVLGSMLVYIPLSIMLIAQGQNTSGIFLLVYGFLIVGSVDNLFRFMLQKRIGDTHPLITIFGVIIGLNLFGFIGLVFGPILISLFLLLVQIYAKEFRSQEVE
jgi:predicted PurR-regulated permease PerM